MKPAIALTPLTATEAARLVADLKPTPLGKPYNPASYPWAYATRFVLNHTHRIPGVVTRRLTAYPLTTEVAVIFADAHIEAESIAAPLDRKIAKAPE